MSPCYAFHLSKRRNPSAAQSLANVVSFHDLVMLLPRLCDEPCRSRSISAPGADIIFPTALTPQSTYGANSRRIRAEVARCVRVAPTKLSLQAPGPQAVLPRVLHLRVDRQANLADGYFPPAPQHGTALQDACRSRAMLGNGLCSKCLCLFVSGKIWTKIFTRCCLSTINVHIVR